MNNVTLMGNIGKDIEMRYSQSANPMAIASFSLAVKRKFAKEGQTDTDWFNLVAFGKTAEFISKYFGKGSSIAIIGHLQVDTWEDKETGQKRSAVKVIVDSAYFTGSKKESQNNNQVADDAFEWAEDMDESDLPF